MGRGANGLEERKVGGEGDLEDLFEDFDLDRPGGGPDEEAMPGAEARQAEGKVGVCIWVRRSQGEVSEGLNTLRGRGDDGGKKQRGAVWRAKFDVYHAPAVH